MNIENQYKCLVECYYGVMELDEYPLKEYILKDIENDIRKFISEYKLSDYNYKLAAQNIKENISVKTKLQSSLIILNKMNVSMELILLVKKRLKELK